MTDYAGLLSGQRIEQEEKARLAEYQTAWNYYNGNHALPLRVKVGQPNDNTIVNLWSYIVDKGVAFLFGKPCEFQFAEGANENAITYLEQTWQANRRMSYLQKLALNGANCGHVFTKLVPRDGQPPRLVNLDPAYVRPLWNPDDVEDVLLYKIEYEGMGADGRIVAKKQLIQAVKDARGVTVDWTISDYERRGQYGEWALVKGPESWGYPFAPICDWQNLAAPNEYFGKPDISSTSLQDAVNFVASNTRRILRYHGHPKTIAKGMRANAIEIGPDDMFVLPSPDSDVHNLEMQSDLASSRAFFGDMRRLFLQTCHMPDLDPAVVNVGALSGFALRILYGDLLELNGKKQITYGDGLTDLCNRILALGGFEDRVTGIQWKDPLPLNKSELAAELNVELNQLGTTSKETAAQELGRDWQLEQEQLGEEKQGQLNIGAALLGAFERGQTQL